jgi:hypothetical protein
MDLPGPQGLAQPEDYNDTLWIMVFFRGYNAVEVGKKTHNLFDKEPSVSGYGYLPLHTVPCHVQKNRAAGKSV